MRKDITEKIRLHLAEPVTREADVVYLLVEIRKLLEPDKKVRPRRYPSLWMHCDWAVHTELDRGQASALVAEIDEYVDKLGLGSGGGLPDAQARKFSDVLNLRRFRDELRQFLRSRSLPSGVCDNDDSWASFLRGYVGVIADCPLTCSSKKRTLAVTDALVIRTEPDDVILDGSRVVSFPVTWELWFKGQKKFLWPGNLA
jgi:hypothetical protein